MAGPVTLPTVTGGTIISSTWGQDVGTNINAILNKPTAFLYQSGTGQSIPNSTNTAVAFNNETDDPLSGHSTVPNNSRWTVPTGWAGRYKITGLVAFTGSATGTRFAWVQVNGTQVVATQDGRTDPPSTGMFARTIADSLQLNVGDYVEIGCFQSSGGALALNVSAGLIGSNMTVEWLRL